MISRLRGPLMRACAVALVLAPVISVSSAVAGTDEPGEVVFRVTLEGPVDPGNTFGVRREYADGCCVVDPIEMVCGIPNPSTPLLPLCSTRTYEFVWEAEVGATIEYELVRWSTADLSSDAAEYYLAGDWTVHEGRQVISLGYVYPGGAPTAPALPDTALSADG